MTRNILKCNIKEEPILNDFINDLNSRINLKGYYRKRIIKSYLEAIQYYISEGLELKEAINKIDLNRLKNVYGDKKDYWYRLDTSSSVYPLIMGHGSMGTFRVSIYLKKKVVVPILQLALNNIMGRFPLFDTNIKLGFFWHYLDSTSCSFKIKEDNELPCNQINISYKNSLGFQVYYYNNRISIDFFHIITDGKGGMIFLNSLVAEYLLLLLGEKVSYNEICFNAMEKPHKEESEDAFIKIPRAIEKKKLSSPKAIQIKGKRNFSKRRVIHFDLNATEVHQMAKKYHVTVTVLMVAYIFLSLRKSNMDKKGKFTIRVPIDLRNVYPTKTLRNFVLYASISIDADKSLDFEYLLTEIAKQMEKGKGLLSQMATNANDVIKNISFIPVILKYPITQLVSSSIAEKQITTTLSNLGVIKLPSDIQKHIIKMDFVLGGHKINRTTFSMITNNNRLVVTMSLITKDQTFLRNIYNILKYEFNDFKIEGGSNYGNRKHLSI